MVTREEKAALLRPTWIDRHSVNCYFCGELIDERDCQPADEYNNDDGGTICPNCSEGIDNEGGE